MEASWSMQSDAQAPAGYDAAKAVPDEYDFICDGCGYSLVGIHSDKCPECGKVFESKQLPFARVPWLHRRRIGRAKAYLATLRFIHLQPRQFAEELLRPVRISIVDARAFRRTTVNLVLLAYLMCMLELAAVVSINYVRDAQRVAFSHYDRLFVYLGVASIIAVTILFGLRMLLYLMTDLPVFIWKGHPSLRETELSPIQCYAAAPLILLLLLPILTLVIIVLYPLLLGWDAMRVIGWCFGIFALLFFIRMLITPLRLMSGSGVNRRRIKLMALYLPAHWLMMAFMCAMITGAAAGLESRIAYSMNPGLRLEPPRVVVPRRIFLRAPQGGAMRLSPLQRSGPATQSATQSR